MKSYLLKRFLVLLVGLSGALSASDCCYDLCDTVWFNAEFLYWNIEDGPKVIPLVHRSFLEHPNPSIVLGGSKVKSRWRPGARFALGFWFDDAQCVGIEAGYFFLGKGNSKRKVFSNGSLSGPILSFPFDNMQTQEEDFLLLSTPGSIKCKARLRLWNQLQGAEINTVFHCCCCDCCDCCSCWDIDFFGGFYFLDFTECLKFRTDSPYLHSHRPSIHYTKDKFHVRNNFYGPQIGAVFSYGCCCDLLFNVRAKIAIGAIAQASHIHGKFVLNDFTNFETVQEFEGGCLSFCSNSGHQKKTRFAVIPELNINIGYCICEGFSLIAGYNVLYVSNVLRASNQPSNKINPTQSPVLEFTPTPSMVGEGRPKRHLRTTDLWAQGLNVGFEFLF